VHLDILDEREQEVIRGRFGLDTGGDERTQWEIAKELGISRSYVSRNEKRALRSECVLYVSYKQLMLQGLYQFL
jgi:RNA polymerase sigma factor (sigma-70 family)